MSQFIAYTTVPTYKKLVEVLQVFLNRYDEDTLNAIPFFINAAEKTILRNLRMPALEKMVSFVIQDMGDADHGFIQLPRDYLEMKFVWVEGKKASTLQRVTFDQLIDQDNKFERYGYDDVGRPVWAINANRMYVRGIDYDETIYMTYYADVPEVSQEQDSNILLDLVPDAFLYFAVAEGFRFLMEEPKADYWETQATKRLEQVKKQVYEAEFSGSPLTISPHGC